MKINLTIWEMVPAPASIQYRSRTDPPVEKATTDLALTGSPQMVADTLRALADSIHNPHAIPARLVAGMTHTAALGGDA